MVTNTNDSGSGSLRQVIADAPAGAEITFHPPLIAYPAAITLSSQLTINKSLTITDPGADHLSLNGNDTARVLAVSGSDTVNLAGSDPLLGDFADNGGETATHNLLAGSPALDAIPYGVNGCGTTLTTDQRGVTRPVPTDGACDMGAVEYITQLTARKRGDGSGTAVVNDQSCDAACEHISVPFTEQTVINPEAIPATGSYFVRWENDAGEPLEGIVYENTDLTIYAVFGGIE